VCIGLGHCRACSVDFCKRHMTFMYRHLVQKVYTQPKIFPDCRTQLINAVPRKSEYLTSIGRHVWWKTTTCGWGVILQRVRVTFPPPCMHEGGAPPHAYSRTKQAPTVQCTGPAYAPYMPHHIAPRRAWMYCMRCNATLSACPHASMVHACTLM
jgi:hypothetical protein